MSVAHHKKNLYNKVKIRNNSLPDTEQIEILRTG